MRGPANLLIMPNVDAANIFHNLLKEVINGVSVGSITRDLALPAHIPTRSTTARRIVNMTAIAVVDDAREFRRSETSPTGRKIRGGGDSEPVRDGSQKRLY